MEKPKRSANKASIISFLPKRSSFAGDGNAHAHLLQNRRGFSGPIVSIVPMEVRRKGKDGAAVGRFEEPTSPKVTCMGQVKLRKMRCNSNRKAKPPPAAEKSNRRRGASLLLGRMFRLRRRAAVSVSASVDEKEILRSNIIPAPAPTLAHPTLGKMRRFASGRETLRDFDWRKMATEGEGAASTNCVEEDDYDNDDDDEVFVAHSAPLLVGSGGVVALEPKKEVNLWKRRTMPAPNPLQLS